MGLSQDALDLADELSKFMAPNDMVNFVMVLQGEAMKGGDAGAYALMTGLIENRIDQLEELKRKIASKSGARTFADTSPREDGDCCTADQDHPPISGVPSLPP
jgi:hypothetical protein